MTGIITEKQAREITGGRKPLVPVEYETAINALIACETLDEAKYWSNKADALAAWAKIYHNDEVALHAKRVKLRAFRRMGEIAAELRPQPPNLGGRHGFRPGPKSKLLEVGLNQTEARAARRIALITSDEFEKIVALPRPPSPGAIQKEKKGCSETYKWFSFTLGHVRSHLRKNDPRESARDVHTDEIDRMRELAIEISEWLDEFERHLPKEHVSKEKR